MEHNHWHFAPELAAGPAVPPATSQFSPQSFIETGKESERHRATYGTGKQREKEICNFFNKTHNPRLGIEHWDPYTKFRSNEDVQAFFNGFEIPMGTGKYVYRQAFAVWAIGEVLKDYQLDNIQITSEAKQNGTVAYHVGSGDKKLPKSIMDAVRVNGQHDVDAGDPFPAKKKNDGMELNQKIGGAAQALISGSPNSLGPPIRPCAVYLQMKKVGVHGREALAVWNSPLFPEVRVRNELHERDKQEEQDEPAFQRIGENYFRKRKAKAAVIKPSRGFFDSQITAIAWILSRFLGDLPKLREDESLEEASVRQTLRGPKYGGAILADSMGLGKTFTAVATMELMAQFGLNVEKHKCNGTPMHCPMLILCPNITVGAQWVEEILQSTSPENIIDILVSGGTTKHWPENYRVNYITAGAFKEWPMAYQHIWDMSNPKASKTVIVMPMDTWASRTCRHRSDSPEGMPVKWYSEFTENERYFSVVYVDEAHKVKNGSTKLFKSVYLLDRAFTLLITATPCLNTLTDLMGPARLLWDNAKFHLEPKSDIWKQAKGIEDVKELSILDTLEPYHDLQLVAGRPALLTRLLCKDRKGYSRSIEYTRRHLRYFESLAMLKRGPGSYIYEDWERTKHISLEGLFPAVDYRTVNISLDTRSASRYQYAHVHLLIEYFELLRNWSEATKKKKKEDKDKSDYKSITTIHRQWQIASSSMDVFNLDNLFAANGFGTTSEFISIMRNNGTTFIEMAKFLLGVKESMPETALDFLRIAIRGSPILRYILLDLKDNVLAPKSNGKIKKLLITEAIPINAYYMELVLQFIGINCCAFHADLTQDQRKELITSFNSDSSDSVQVLIQMYTVGFAGSNLHKSCSRVIVASQAYSLPIQWQAIHRVIRVGQTEDVQVFRLKVNNSYHAFRESRQIEKILPELGTRAQAEMNDILVQLLNLFQDEVEDAWKSDEGQQLITSKNLLSYNDSSPVKQNVGDEISMDMKIKELRFVAKEGEAYLDARERDVHSTTIKQGDINVLDLATHINKKRKLEDGVEIKSTTWDYDGSSRYAKYQLDPEADGEQDVEKHGEIPGHYMNSWDTVSVTSVSTTATTSTASSGKRTLDVPGFEGWFKNTIDVSSGNADLERFLALKPRQQYYEEFKMLPKTKSHFDHQKNQLRRLLSFHRVDDDGHTPKKWTLEDLDNPAVLERAIEIMLRVQLGADQIEMLPFPQINFSNISRKDLKALYKALARVCTTDQDVEAAQVQTESKKAKQGLRDTIHGVDSGKSLEEIDKCLEDEVKYSVGRKSAAIRKNQEYDDEHGEGEDPDSDDDALPGYLAHSAYGIESSYPRGDRQELTTHQDIDLVYNFIRRQDTKGDIKTQYDHKHCLLTQNTSDISLKDGKPSAGNSPGPFSMDQQVGKNELKQTLCESPNNNGQEISSLLAGAMRVKPKDDDDLAKTGNIKANEDTETNKPEKTSKHEGESEELKFVKTEKAGSPDSAGSPFIEQDESRASIVSPESSEEKGRIDHLDFIKKETVPSEIGFDLLRDKGLSSTIDRDSMFKITSATSWGFSGLRFAETDAGDTAIEGELGIKDPLSRGVGSGNSYDKFSHFMKQEESDTDHKQVKLERDDEEDGGDIIFMGTQKAKQKPGASKATRGLDADEILITDIRPVHGAGNQSDPVYIDD